MRSVRGSLAALLLAVLAATALTGAETQGGFGATPNETVVDGLSASITSPLALPRLNAPYPLLITVTARGQRVREGHFEIVVASGTGKQFVWQGEPLVLAAGQRTSAVLLPAITYAYAADEVALTLHWCEGEQRLVLTTRTLVRLGDQEHLVTLGLCLPPTARDEDRGSLARLALERYAPDVAKAADRIARTGGPTDSDEAVNFQPGRGSGLRTVMARLQREDLPDAALAWCAYDAVVIAGDTLSTITTRQVLALERWLRGGGSACLMSDGRVAPAVADLLRRAAQGSADAVAVQRYLTPGVADGPSPAHVRLALGLGRLVVSAWPAKGPDDNGQWRRSAAFLWQTRADQAAALTDDSCWDAERFTVTNQQYDNQYTRNRSGNPGQPFTDHPLELRDQLVELLWPKHVQIIPFSIILLLFLVFVVMIGPGDWFLLGWLRGRRFTWLLFPLIALGCTGFTVWLSRQYLGANDHYQHLQIVDLASDGTQLRRNHLELLFSGSSKQVETQVQDSLWSALGSGHNPDNRYRYGRYAPDQSEVGPTDLTYHGALPAQYAVVQDVAQWTPLLRRELTFTPCQLPWQVPTAAITRRADVADSCAPWLEAAGPRSAVLVLHGGRVVATYGDADVLQRNSSDHDTSMERNELLSRAGMDWLTALCSHPTQGWFALATSCAPTGGPTYDDLAVCDPSDAQQFLVVFAAWRDDTLWLVRCRYPTDGPPGGGPPP